LQRAPRPRPPGSPAHEQDGELVVSDCVSELVDGLELDAAGRVYAELALTLAERIDHAQRPAGLVRELRAVLATLTGGGERDALLGRIFGALDE
jgi:hypothetical protein